MANWFGVDYNQEVCFSSVFKCMLGPQVIMMMVAARMTETCGEITMGPRHNRQEIVNIVNMDNGRVSLKPS